MKPVPHYRFDRHRRALGWLFSCGLALVVGAVIAADVGMQHALKRAVQRRDTRLATEAVAKLVVPRDYREVDRGCFYYRCYVVRRGAASVAADARGILASAGATSDPASDASCDRDPVVAPGGEVCDDDGYVHHRLVKVRVLPVQPATRPAVTTARRPLEVEIWFFPEPLAA